MMKKQSVINFILWGVVLIVLCFLSLRFGSVSLSVKAFWNGIYDYKMSTSAGIILYSIRLPRMFACVLCGVGLSVSGAVLQKVTGNKMASPGLIGTSSGAGFAVILTMSLFPMLYKFLPIISFFGAFFATALIVAIAYFAGLSRNSLVLVGLSLSAILSSFISFVSLLDSEALIAYNGFSIGSVAGVKTDSLIFPAVMIIFALVLCIVLNKKIDLITLGDDVAKSLGVNVKRTRIMCLVLCSMTAAAVVSFAGLVGFVGLMSPHIAKMFVHSRAKVFIPFSALVGAGLVLLADLLSRVLFSPSELPVGLVLSLVGAPFFLCLLLFSKREVD